MQMENLMTNSYLFSYILLWTCNDDVLHATRKSNAYMYVRCSTVDLRQF